MDTEINFLIKKMNESVMIESTWKHHNSFLLQIMLTLFIDHMILFRPIFSLPTYGQFSIYLVLIRIPWE